MEENNIIFENVQSEEYLTEMTQIYSVNDNFGILIAITPDLKHIGNRYFKVYNGKTYSSATKVARISFLKPELIINHRERNGKPEWKLNDINIKTRKELIDYLNSTSDDNKNYTVWTFLRYSWNRAKLGIRRIEDYTTGVFDKEFFGNPNYVPYNIPMPDYLNLRNEEKGN